MNRVSNPGATEPTMFLYEKRGQPLIPLAAFLRRIAVHGGAAVVIVVASLLAGTWGYRYFEGMAWIDAFLNASMILSGMGPVTALRTVGGKLFASAYALYSSVVFLVVTGLMFAPFLHRLLHRLHIDGGDGS